MYSISDKKGLQINIVSGMIIAIIIIIFGIITLPGINDVVSDSRTNLNCSSDDITTGTKMTCIAQDTYLLLFFGMILIASTYYIRQK